MLFIPLLIVLYSLCSCGVKTPVVAPEKSYNNDSGLNLDCSPTEPDCDAIDPDYIPSQSE